MNFCSLPSFSKMKLMPIIILVAVLTFWAESHFVQFTALCPYNTTIKRFTYRPFSWWHDLISSRSVFIFLVHDVSVNQKPRDLKMVDMCMVCKNACYNRIPKVEHDLLSVICCECWSICLRFACNFTFLRPTWLKAACNLWKLDATGSNVTGNDEFCQDEFHYRVGWMSLLKFLAINVLFVFFSVPWKSRIFKTPAGDAVDKISWLIVEIRPLFHICCPVWLLAFTSSFTRFCGKSEFLMPVTR